MVKMEEENTRRSRKLNGDGLLNRQSLPDDLIIDILLRLPVRFLLQLKCVCKSWKTLISNSRFAKQHLQMLTMDQSITNPQFFFGRGDRKIVSLPVKPLLENHSETTEAVEFSMEHRFRVLGSCNGLVCLLDIDEGYVRLWNPSTRFKSKNSPSLDKSLVTNYGFGYDHVNDKYKVLLDVCPRGNSNNQNVRLYTFGENSWTTIQNFPCNPTTFPGKFVSGTINWVIIRQVEYGVAESWTRLKMIPAEHLQGPYCAIEPLFIFGNSLVLLKTMHGILLYNLNNGRTDIPLISTSNLIGLKQHLYLETLVSPQLKSKIYNEGVTKIWDIGGDELDLFDGAAILEVATLSLNERELEAAFNGEENIDIQP
ncbi:F-box/kelch-repeat protein At3g23880-like [Vicia villosa]|uniref:F-box/kelch-repeat protein At3g23880-like n=1 Tax=Vicia villosa TaxID=3911 RepID=UPI00273C16E2|nr:F-box/kelch-repeat protein At3g23880-like [Vicia villosa]